MKNAARRWSERAYGIDPIFLEHDVPITPRHDLEGWVCLRAIHGGRGAPCSGQNGQLSLDDNTQ